jgi:hypothetical protein
MPVRVADSSCIFCGHSYADLQEFSIPPEASEDPNKQQLARGEPAVRHRVQLPARHAAPPPRPSTVVVAASNATVILDRVSVGSDVTFLDVAFTAQDNEFTEQS